MAQEELQGLELVAAGYRSSILHRRVELKRATAELFEQPRAHSRYNPDGASSRSQMAVLQGIKPVVLSPEVSNTLLYIYTRYLVTVTNLCASVMTVILLADLA